MKTSTIVRKAFAAGNMVRDAGLKTPEDVQRFDEFSFQKRVEDLKKGSI